MTSLQRALAEALGSQVAKLRPLAGGDINDAYALTLADGRALFVKTRADAPARMYACEAEGLRWLAEAGALPCPGVVAVAAQFLVLELVTPGARRADFEERLGRGLAALHRHGAPSHGFTSDNFIANLPQPNAPAPSFAQFYRARRLEPLAAELGLGAQFEPLYAKLDALIPDEPPARLHGDLWSGNVHADAQGGPMLIDPAVYGGFREMDLAMLQLFGAPSPRLFAAYDEVHPRAPGSAERVPLLQLYPLLVHAKLFGASYRAGISRALARYV